MVIKRYKITSEVQYVCNSKRDCKGTQYLRENNILQEEDHRE